MSDLASMRAVLKLNLKSNSSYVDMAIADAIRIVRTEELWFNGARYEFYTVANQYRYPMPSDFLGLRGKPRVTLASSTTTGRRTLLPSTSDEIEDLLYEDADYGSYLLSGSVTRYAIDFLGKEMLIAPMPSSGGDKVQLKYTRDLGTPKYTVSATSSAPPSLSATVTLLDPSGATLPGTFTNEWFGEGFKLVKERALYELYTQFHAGTEEAVIEAQAAKVRYDAELLRLRNESAQIQSVLKIRKHL